MTDDTATTPRVTRSTALRIALVLSLGVLLVGSVRFARFDWTGIPLERGRAVQERVVSEDCTEYIRPYTTSSGRTISPVSVDEQQYLSMVELFSGAPRDELHVTCLLAPFTSRPALPFVASLLPFDEAVSIGTVNLAMTLLATWAIVFTLRAQGAGARATALVGALFAISWNTLFFSSAILVDAGVVALVATCWWAMAARRAWWVPLLLLVSYPIKETAAVLVLPTLAVWLWGELRAGRRSTGAAAGLLAAAVVASFGSFVVSASWFLDSDATWELAPSLGSFVNNVLGPVSLATFLLGTAPLFVPALLRMRDRRRQEGWRSVAMDPAAVGVAVTLALLAWVTLAADLSSRFAWVGAPYAASLAAEWFGRGRPAEWLQGLGRTRRTETA
jgi:hypothetical protein